MPPRAGVREALLDSGGQTYAVGNDHLGNAMSLFAELEGVGIEAAAGVAVASLAGAVAGGAIERYANVLLHITGGGRLALPTRTTTVAAPTLVLARGELATTAVDRTRALLG